MSAGFQESTHSAEEPAKPRVGIIPGAQGTPGDFDPLIEACDDIAQLLYFPRPNIPIPKSRKNYPKWDRDVLDGYLADLPTDLDVLVCHSRGCRYGLEILKIRSQLRGALLISPASKIPRGIYDHSFGTTERGTPVENLLLPLLTTMKQEYRQQMLIRHAKAYERNTGELDRIMVELQLLRSESDVFDQIRSVKNKTVVVLNSLFDHLYATILPTDKDSVTMITASDSEDKKGHYLHIEWLDVVTECLALLMKQLNLPDAQTKTKIQEPQGEARITI